MKSLVLKDLYNISHNGKSLFLILVIFTFCFLPQEDGVYTLIVTCGLIFNMMIITTFSFDDQSNWLKFAMTMPVSRKDVITSKFLILIIFSITGVVLGLIAGVGGGIFLNKFHPESGMEWLSVLGTGAASLMLAVFFGSCSIPLLFRFGAEKARLLSIISFAVPVLLLFLSYQLITGLGYEITETLIKRAILFSPVFIILWCLLMYRISYMVFKNKDL